VFAAHGEHVAAPAPENWPGGQLVHDVEPAIENCPAGHEGHAPACQKEPPGQLQLELPATEVLVPGHAVHAGEPATAANVFTGQLEQAARPVVEVCPARH
jgi:hypothetical protein